MCRNSNSWSCYLHHRDIYRAGQVEEGRRKRGPEEFPVPCTFDVTIDANRGTLSLAVVGGEDPGVVVDGLPTNASPLLVVGTFDEVCR